MYGICYNPCMVYRLALWVLLIVTRSLGIEQRHLLHHKRLLLLYINVFALSIVRNLHILFQRM